MIKRKSTKPSKQKLKQIFEHSLMITKKKLKCCGKDKYKTQTWEDNMSYKIQMKDASAVSQVINHLGTGVPKEIDVPDIVPTTAVP